jgi:hypothetical protein
MTRRKLYGQFHQPSHILRYYHIEMECFVYNWRILLGGAASAAILTVGVAAPAFAQAQDAPVSLSGLNSASGAPGVANTSGTFGDSAPASTGLSSDGSSNSGSGTGSSTGLGSVTGTLSGVTGGLQNGGSITTPLSGVNGG